MCLHSAARLLPPAHGLGVDRPCPSLFMSPWARLHTYPLELALSPIASKHSHQAPPGTVTPFPVSHFDALLLLPDAHQQLLGNTPACSLALSVRASQPLTRIAPPSIRNQHHTPRTPIQAQPTQLLFPVPWASTDHVETVGEGDVDSALGGGGKLPSAIIAWQGR